MTYRGFSSATALAAIGLSILIIACPEPVAAQAPGAQHPPQAAAPGPLLSADQLDNLVAPVALYPDPMLGQVLVASTYPLELVEAAQWLKTTQLHGTELMTAARQQAWDPSIQAMIAFPQVLDRLSQDVRWTVDLGNAFLAQQTDVLAAVQRMRARAEANGKLNSNVQQSVSTVDSAIQIMPVDPQVIYVPSYDPAYIWGDPVWGVYPSLWYPPYGWGFWPGINIGFWFGGWGAGWGWHNWGWCPGWSHGGVFVNNRFFNSFGFHGGAVGSGGIWAHNPSHRLGVPYPNAGLNSRFGAASLASRANAIKANPGSAGVRGLSGQSTMPRMNPGASTFQGNRGSTQGFSRGPAAPAYRGGSIGNPGMNRGFGGGGFHGFGGGGGFGGGHFGGGGGGHFGGGGGGHGGGHR